MRSSEMTFLFTETFPEKLEQSVVYISREDALACHLCACGCGYEVALELGRGGWRLDVVDGKISLYPSVGNGSHPCKSHYFITDGVVEWSTEYTPAMIAKARRADNPRVHVDPTPVVRLGWWARRKAQLLRFLTRVMNIALGSK
jgi:hypothetical protein